MLYKISDENEKKVKPEPEMRKWKRLNQRSKGKISLVRRK